MAADLAPILAALDRGARGADLETAQLDFKTEKRDDFKATASDLAEAALCFANASGGVIVLGVSDKPDAGGTSYVGTSIDADALRRKIHDLTRPPLTVQVAEFEHKGVRLIRIDVPEGVEVYATTKGAHYRRHDTDCLPMAAPEVARLSTERRGEDWSAGPSGHRIDEVDGIAVEQARIMLRATQDEARIATSRLPTPQLLANLELLRNDGELTRAGAILLVSDRNFGPRETVIYQHRKSATGEVDYSRRWREPLLLTLPELLEVIGARTRTTPLNLRNGQQVLLEDYPSIAVREAVANALTHRDYVIEQPVSVIHSPEELIITSPGPLVTGVTTNNFLSRGTRPRYPLLARAVNRLGLVEYLGQGFNRMFRAMAGTGRPLPKLVDDPDSTSVLLSGAAPDMRVARLVADLPEKYREDTNTLLVLARLCQKRSVTAVELSPLLQRDLPTTEGVLRTLASDDASLIEPTNGTKNRKHPNYRLQGPVLGKLGPAVHYYVNPAASGERKIIEHLREYGSINSKAVQRMLDIDVYAARDILRSLTDRAIIVRTSTQTRGTAVKYGHGPNFPKAKGKNTAPPSDAPSPGGERLF